MKHHLTITMAIMAVIFLFPTLASAEQIKIQADIKIDGQAPENAIVALAYEGPATPPRTEYMEDNGNGLFSLSVDFLPENTYTVEIRTESMCDPYPEWHPCVEWFNGMTDQVDLEKIIWMLQILAGVR